MRGGLPCAELVDAVREVHRGRRVDIDVVLGAVRAEAGAGDERGGGRAGRADVGAHRNTRTEGAATTGSAGERDVSMLNQESMQVQIIITPRAEALRPRRRRRLLHIYYWLQVGHTTGTEKAT